MTRSLARERVDVGTNAEPRGNPGIQRGEPMVGTLRDELPVACPHCAHGFGRPATQTAYVIYYRCTFCVGVWSVARPGVVQILGPDPEPRPLPYHQPPGFDR